MSDRKQMVEAAKAAAWDEGADCTACDGTGKVAGGRQLIHSFSPRGFGANWNLEGVLDAIEKSPRVRWASSFLDHNLVIEIDDKDYRFAVPMPADVKPDGAS